MKVNSSQFIGSIFLFLELFLLLNPGNVLGRFPMPTLSDQLMRFFDHLEHQRLGLGQVQTVNGSGVVKTTEPEGKIFD